MENHNIALLNMGDSAFWFNQIERNISDIVKSKKIDYWENCIVKNLQVHHFQGLLHHNFTYDVVYSLSDIANALLYDPKLFLANVRTSTLVIGITLSENELVERANDPSIPDDAMRKELINFICSHFGMPTFFSRICESFQVWNAKMQKLEMRFGITNSSLITLIQKNQKLKNILSVCFESDYNKKIFTSHCALKDAMYSQYPVLLEKLLQHTLKNYRDVGVNRVEFSIDVENVNRPWIWNRLIALNFNDYEVAYKYFITFSRKMIMQIQSDNTILETLKNYLVNTDMYQMIVGIDYLNDETNSSLLVIFRDFATDMKIHKNGFFELRIH